MPRRRAHPVAAANGGQNVTCHSGDILEGTYHNVSKKYLPLYLAEFQYRFNNRDNKNIFFDVIAGC